LAGAEFGGFPHWWENAPGRLALIDAHAPIYVPPQLKGYWGRITQGPSFHPYAPPIVIPWQNPVPFAPPKPALKKLPLHPRQIRSGPLAPPTPALKKLPPHPRQITVLFPPPMPAKSALPRPDVEEVASILADLENSIDAQQLVAPEEDFDDYVERVLKNYHDFPPPKGPPGTAV
jgi:hypothetical protein